jgi:glycosyltransferase involved in cell wall biosynthesis
MKYYCFSTLSPDYHSQAHCDVHIAYGLADGLQALGKDAVVLWGGKKEVINGVMHENWENVRLAGDDCLLYYSRIAGDNILSDRFSNAGLKIWYPSFTNGVEDDYWDYVMIDNDTYVKGIQEKAPFTRVIFSMFGCPDKIKNNADPYPAGRKNLFYAGRMMERDYKDNGSERISHVTAIRRLLFHLPANYHIWLASACVWMPYDCRDPRVAGHVATSPMNGEHEPYSRDYINDYVYMPREDLVNLVRDYFNTDRIHFMGPVAYGSFDGYIQHADCIIDFGFLTNVPGPNCKIMEPLRYGTPVVADGISFSFPLIEDYGLGLLVPYRNMAAMAQAIQAMPAISHAERIEHGEIFNEHHSWRCRARDLLKKIGR